MAKNDGKSIAKAKAGKYAKKSSRPLAIICICCVLFLIVTALIGFSYYLYDFQFNGTISPNVTIAGINVGGMTRDQAVAELTSKINDSYTSTAMVVKVFDTSVEISPKESGANINIDSAVKEAYLFGKKGLPSQKKADLHTAATVGYAVDMSEHITLNEQGIRSALNAFSDHYATTVSESSYEVTGTAPDLTLVVHKGIPNYGLDLDKLYNQVVTAYYENDFVVEAECEMMELKALDLKSILSAYKTEPVDAKFDTTTFEVIAGINGCGFNPEKVQATIDSTPYGESVEIPFDQTEPETTTEMLSSVLFRDELGYHSGTQASSDNRATNLRLACEAINGVVILPGEDFSYNETLGERTEERGYKTGIAYVGGKSVPSIGGGICQVSSTLYYCTLQADLEILDRENHCYAPGYVPLGMDATVSWGTLDFCFKNNTEYPIKIEAHAEGGTTTVRLLGTDTKDYYIKMEYSVTGTYQYETTYEEMTADNPDGYKDGDVIVSPTVGYDVVTYRCKYKKSDDTLISRDFEAKSHFSKRDAVICKIVDSTTTTPTDPSTPSDQPTDPGIGNGGVTDDSGTLPD